MRRPERGSRKWRGRASDPSLDPKFARSTPSLPATSPEQVIAGGPIVEQRQRRPLHDRLVRLTQGFWAESPPFRVQYVDLTRIVTFTFQEALAGPVLVLNATVPPGRVWLVDDFYFFARRPNPFPRLIPRGEFEDGIGFTVGFEGSNNIEYSYTHPDAGGIIRPYATVPMLNDRLGPREQRFALWLVENENVRATFQSILPVPPVTPISDIGFRIMATQTERAYAESVMDEQR